MEHRFKRSKRSRLLKALVAGILLSLLCVLFPPLFGEGYSTVKQLAAGKIETIVNLSFFGYFTYRQWFVLVFLGLICVFKAFATSITIYGGGNGGNFAPALFAGGTLGYFMGVLCMQLGIENVPITNMVIVGMAGVMSGVLYAPLTAIFLIAESSSGYDLFIPLMIVSVASFLIAKRFSAIIPDLAHLAGEGKIFTREHDSNLLSLIRTAELIDDKMPEIGMYASFEDLIGLVVKGKKNFVAVTNDDGLLEGIIKLDDIRTAMFNKELYRELSVQKVMVAPAAVIQLNEDVREIVKKFDETGTWNLPVVKEGKYVGFISKSNILNRYRDLLKEYS